MQITCQTLILLGALTAQPPSAPPSSRGPVHNPLDYAKVTIIDQVQVPAEEAGVLLSLNVHEGSLVEKGQLLGRIDDRDATLAVEIAKYELGAAKLQAENQLSVKAAGKARDVAEAEHDMAIEANQRTPGTVTKTDIRRRRLTADRSLMQMDLAKHELAIAKHDFWAKYNQLKRAEAMLERRKIVSRINGVVVELQKHAGDWVQPGEPVMRIVRMDQLRVEGFLDGNQYARHEVIGRPVDIEVELTGGGTERMEGVISFASPLVESDEFKIWAEIDNRKTGRHWLLNPGLDAKMRLRDVRAGGNLTAFP